MPTDQSNSVSNDPQGPSRSTGESPLSTAPQASDAALKRAGVMLRSAEVRVAETFPVQVTLHLDVVLPDICHQLRAALPAQAAHGGIIDIPLYTVVDPAQTCAKDEHDLSAVIPLNQYSGGNFTVLVNGRRVGQFTR